MARYGCAGGLSRSRVEHSLLRWDCGVATHPHTDEVLQGNDGLRDDPTCGCRSRADFGDKYGIHVTETCAVVGIER